MDGHVYDPNDTAYQDWPKFTRTGLPQNGLRGSRSPGYYWRPLLLMGAGTGSHENDPVVTGLWRPAATNDFFTHSPTAAIDARAGKN